MKPKKHRELTVFLILIPVFLWASFFVSSRLENKLPAYSVVNKASLGSSVFFESLKELKMPVERTLRPVNTQPVNTVQIVVPGGFDINDEAVKAWIEDGGVLVHLAAENLHIINYGSKTETKGNVSIYRYGNGVVIASNALDITNKTLMSNTNNAYELLQEIGNYRDRKIYFNEAHLFLKPDKTSLWDYIPLWGRLMIFQFVLSLAAFFYYKGKRFGKAYILYEEAERSENEYLYSASSLYRQAKCYDLIADNYYKNLLKEIKCSHEDWIEYWEREELPSLNKAKQVYEFMNNLKGKRKAKDYIQIVSAIEQLNNIIKKRRDSYWKTLKRT